MANILMVIPALYCGGGLQKISLQLSQELIKRGHDVTVVDEYAPPMEKLNYLEIFPKFEKINSYNCDRYNLQTFIEILKTNSAELIIYQGFIPKVSNFLKSLKKIHDIKIISVFHNSPDASLPKGLKSLNHDLKGIIKSLFYPLYYLYSRRKVSEILKIPYLFSERVMLLSPKFIGIYEHMTGMNDKIKTIPNFIRRNLDNNCQKKKQLLYVGRLEEDAKKVSRIIRIWEKISVIKSDWELVLAGEGRCEEIYKEYISKKGIERVKFLGYIPNPIDLYSESSISLMTSDFEGFPMALVEAMSVGCVPVAYKSFKSITDIIDDGINGILVKPFKENEYILKLIKLMDDDVFLKELSTNAVVKAATFSDENIIPKWEELIKEVIESEPN